MIAGVAFNCRAATSRYTENYELRTCPMSLRGG